MTVLYVAVSCHHPNRFPHWAKHITVMWGEGLQIRNHISAAGIWKWVNDHITLSCWERERGLEERPFAALLNPWDVVDCCGEQPKSSSSHLPAHTPTHLSDWGTDYSLAAALSSSSSFHSRGLWPPAYSRGETGRHIQHKNWWESFACPPEWLHFLFFKVLPVL